MEEEIDSIDEPEVDEPEGEEGEGTLHPLVALPGSWNILWLSCNCWQQI